MSDISFEEDQALAPPRAASESSYLTRLVLMTGIVKDEAQVQYVLLGIAVICILIAAGLFLFGGVSGSGPAPLTPSSPNWPKAGSVHS